MPPEQDHTPTTTAASPPQPNDVPSTLAQATRFTNMTFHDQFAKLYLGAKKPVGTYKLDEKEQEILHRAEINVLSSGMAVISRMLQV